MDFLFGKWNSSSVWYFGSSRLIWYDHHDEQTLTEYNFIFVWVVKMKFQISTNYHKKAKKFPNREYEMLV